METRVQVCIPTYNNQTTLKKVVEDCLTLSTLPVLVIDDGSCYDVDFLLSDLKNSRLNIVHHEKNMGKGKALQTAFANSIEHGYSHALCLDGDGQHLASEINKILEEIKKDPNALIIGKRDFEKTQNVPNVSKFGRAFSNYWVKYQTDVIISDSQSGFRAYPLFYIQNTKFYTKRFDFEIEILIRLLWKNIKIKEIAINTVYQKPEERISHFNKCWDNVRISILNTILVFFTLFRTGSSSKKIALATMLGVFVGCTPLWGLHSFIVFVISFLFRLNFVVLWIGTQISIPPLVPLLVVASLFLGKHVTGYNGNINKPLDNFFVYFTGSLILGLILGITLGFIVYFITKKKKIKKLWSGKSRGGKFGNLFFDKVLDFLGLKFGYFFLYFVVPYFYFFAPKAKKSSLQYWKIVRPMCGFFKRRFCVLKHFYTFATIILDKRYQEIKKKQQFVRNESGLDYIKNNFSNKQPIILIGSHVGNWNIASFFIKENQTNNFITVEYDYYNNYNKDVITINTNNPIFDIREQLEEGKALALMIDRPVSSNFILVPFFKKLTPFDVTAFRIATITKTPLCFFFGFKLKNNEYSFLCTEPKNYSYDSKIDRTEQHYLWVKEFSEKLEQLINEYPEQWLNFYPVWTSLPK